MKRVCRLNRGLVLISVDHTGIPGSFVAAQRGRLSGTLAGRRANAVNLPGDPRPGWIQDFA